MKSIKLKLIICFASIVLIFVLGGLVIFAGIQSAGEQSRQFVTQHWPTANLLMESRIEIAGIAKDLLQPPTGDAAADYLQQTEMALDRLSERFKTANLKPAEIRQVAQLLQRLKEAVPKPVVLAYLPG